MSVDGVVQAPGGREEGHRGLLRQRRLDVPVLSEDVMGSVIVWVMEKTEALLFGRRTWQTMAAQWPRRAGTRSPTG